VSFIEPRKLEVLSRPFFIVTEGMADAYFVDELLKHKAITKCSVGCPSKDSAGGMGKPAFGKYLLGMQTARARKTSVNLQGLLVIADADENPAKSFKDVTDALDNAQFPKPTDPFQVQDINGFRSAVYLIPAQGETGTLEHLLLRATFLKSQGLEQCLAQFSECTGGLKSTDANSNAKMRMSVLAGAFCKGNPWCSAGLMWKDEGNPVPIDSKAFDALSAFIVQFSD